MKNYSLKNNSQTKPLKYSLTLLSLSVLIAIAGCEQVNYKASQQSNHEQLQSLEKQEQQQRLDKHRVDQQYQAKARMKSKRTSSQELLYAQPMLSSVQSIQPITFPAADNIAVVKVDNENYLTSSENPVKQVSVDPVSTFSVDVDTGSYSNSRRLLNAGQLPPTNAVREEAFINYFNYNYPAPTDTTTPFNVFTEVNDAPWNKERQLLKIGIKGFEVAKADLKAANLVFLLDVSGSMNAPNKLPLLKASLNMLTKQLDEQDSVAIVVYAGAAGVVLPATPGNDQAAISNALDQLSAGGSTNGEQGIELAYQIAQQNFKKGGVNRVIFATDGDFNVGMQSIDKLKELVAKKRETGIALTTLGFGQGNYNDGLMEQLANIGNGQHAYIDTINEARKVLVDEISSTLQIIAKDVKIQVEFNPQQVAEYRLIGYQNRLLANEDFNNDKVDAAELGAGHTVTALYEITLTSSKNKQIDELRYQSRAKEHLKSKDNSQELAFVKIRYKQPDSDFSQLISQPVMKVRERSEPSSDFKFAAAVAGFAQLLKGAKYTGQWQYQDCVDLAVSNKGLDSFGYRAEFIQLVRTAGAL